MIRIFVSGASGLAKERGSRQISPDVNIHLDGKDYLSPEDFEKLFDPSEYHHVRISNDPVKIRFSPLFQEQIVSEYNARPNEESSQLALPVRGIHPEKVRQLLEKIREIKNPTHPFSLRNVSGYRKFVQFAKAFNRDLDKRRSLIEL